MRIAQSLPTVTTAQAEEAKADCARKLDRGSDTALAAPLLTVPAFLVSGLLWMVAGGASPTPYLPAVHLGELGMYMNSAVGLFGAALTASLAGAAALVRRS